jgi:hypothetical protein
VKQKHLYIVWAINFALMSIIILTGPLWGVPGTSTSFLFVIIFSPLSAFLSYWYLKKSKQVTDEEKVSISPTPPVNASNEEKISFYRKIMIGGIIGSSFLIIITVMDLNELGSGESVMVWFPIAFLYKIGGYWFTILSLIGVLAFIVIRLSFKIKRLASQS